MVWRIRREYNEGWRIRWYQILVHTFFVLVHNRENLSHWEELAKQQKHPEDLLDTVSSQKNGLKMGKDLGESYPAKVKPMEHDSDDSKNVDDIDNKLNVTGHTDEQDSTFATEGKVSPTGQSWEVITFCVTCVTCPSVIKFDTWWTKWTLGGAWTAVTSRLYHAMLFYGSCYGETSAFIYFAVVVTCTHPAHPFAVSVTKLSHKLTLE